MPVLKSNDNGNSSSRTGPVLASAAFFGGAGYGAYKVRGDLSRLVKKTPNIVNQTVSRASGLGPLTTLRGGRGGLRPPEGVSAHVRGTII